MNTSPLHIFGRPIGPTEPVFVIAEIGVNHDGSLARALELVETAAECGADAVKLQIFRAASLMHTSSVFAGYQRERCEEADPTEMLRRYELAESDLARVVEAIREHGMIPIATPFSTSDVNAVANLALPAVKIASPDLVNRVLLSHVARLRKPMLLSTGAATMDEVAETVRWLTGWGASFALLHCISSYPVTKGDANLCWIGELATATGAVIGYSDHTTDALCGALAAVAGACIVEKHLTYDNCAAGPDHSASADPKTFAEYVRLLRSAEKLRGRPGKRVLPTEQDVRRVSRQSIVLSRALRPGDVLREEDFFVQRPGTGIPAADAGRVVGRKLTQALEAGTMLQWDMLADAA